jgi:hypothetical protein
MSTTIPASPVPETPTFLDDLTPEPGLSLPMRTLEVGRQRCMENTPVKERLKIA